MPMPNIIFWTIYAFIGIVYARFLYHRYTWAWEEPGMAAFCLGAVWPTAGLVHIALLLGDLFHKKTPRRK